ncbi:MAG: copper resistance protein CopC [Cryobacterium sp.]
MARDSARRRGPGRTLLGTVLVAGMVTLFAAPAWAHNYVVDLGPGEGSVVTTQPVNVFVTTNEALLDLDGTGAGSAIQVSGPADAPLYYGDGCITVAAATAQTTAQLGAAGEYTVTWQVVSTDGHPISDDFTFQWQPGTGEELAAGSATPPDCGGADASDGVAEGAADADGPVAADDAPADGLSDAAWIGSALGAVALAVMVVLLVLRRRP